MRNMTILLAVLAVSVLAGPASAAVLYETGFETNDGFSDNTSVDTIDGWALIATGGNYGAVITEEDSHISGLMSLKAYKTDSYGRAKVTFTNTTDCTVVAEFKIKISDLNNSTYLALWDDDIDHSAVTLRFDGNTDQIQHDSGGSWTNIQSYNANTVYTIKMVADTEAQTYDIYIGGDLKADDKAFSATTSGKLNTFYIGRTGTGAAYLDDLSIIPEPATMVLLGIGGLGLLIRRRRS